MQVRVYPATSTPTPKKLLANGVLTVASYGVHKPLSENLIAALVAFDNRKHRMRFDLGHFTPGRSQSSQLVIRLSSTTVPHPIGIFFLINAALVITTVAVM